MPPKSNIILRLSIISIAVFTLLGSRILTVESSRILAVQTIAGRSHWNFMSAVLRALTKNGHQVTVFTPLVDGDRENYTEVDTSSIFPIKLNLDPAEVRAKFDNVFTSISFVMELGRFSCELLYNNERLNETLNDAQTKFDAIIIEPLIADCLTYVATNSNLPMIFIVPLSGIAFSDRTVVGDIPNPATVSHAYADFAIPKTFTQRFRNTVVLLYTVTVLKFHEYLLKVIENKPYDLNTPVSPSLVFINSHFITDASRPISSNVVNVGGIHLKEAKRIPKDILEFIEESPHGVVYFTFGSTVAMSLLSKHIQKVFKDALGQLPQRVLWKYEGEMEDQPKNVMTKKWLPQRDILLHPNVKLFISHGGISGLYEAVDAGVPVLGFPLFADQFRNIDNLVESGMAISMELYTLSKDVFFNNLLELLNNEKYAKNAKIVSEQFKDRPLSPEQSVVYWTEYVIRHKGASHLKSHAFNLSWYQYFLLDVFFVVLLAILLLFFIIYKIFMFISNRSIFKYLQINKTKSE